MLKNMYKPICVKSFFDAMRIVDSLTKNGYSVCVEYFVRDENEEENFYEITYRLTQCL